MCASRKLKHSKKTFSGFDRNKNREMNERMKEKDKNVRCVERFSNMDKNIAVRHNDSKNKVKQRKEEEKNTKKKLVPMRLNSSPDIAKNIM